MSLKDSIISTIRRYIAEKESEGSLKDSIISTIRRSEVVTLDIGRSVRTSYFLVLVFL